MASVVAENWECIESLPQDDHFESLDQFSHVNQGLLMSFLEETQVDDCGDDDDEERLSKVIQSLEAEISLGSHGPAELNDESSGQDWSLSPHDLDHHKWMDVEFAPSSPSGDMEKYWSFESSHEQGVAGTGTSVLDQWTDDETYFVSSVVIDRASSFI